MNLRLPPHRRRRCPIKLLDRWQLRHSVVSCVWAFYYFCFSYRCSPKWEGLGGDIILPIQDHGKAVRGKAIPGEEVPGEAGPEDFHPAGSPQVEVEAFRVRECEGEAVVVAQDGLINI